MKKKLAKMEDLKKMKKYIIKSDIKQDKKMIMKKKKK